MTRDLNPRTIGRGSNLDFDTKPNPSVVPGPDFADFDWLIGRKDSFGSLGSRSELYFTNNEKARSFDFSNNRAPDPGEREMLIP